MSKMIGCLAPAFITQAAHASEVAANLSFNQIPNMPGQIQPSGLVLYSANDQNTFPNNVEILAPFLDLTNFQAYEPTYGELHILPVSPAPFSWPASSPDVLGPIPAKLPVMETSIYHPSHPPAAPVPEPGTWFLFGAGLLAVLALRRIKVTYHAD